jgi:hypothetical protein
MFLCLAGSAAAQGPKRDAVDQSVARALAFLQKTQQDDGAWADHGGKSPAVTSLAVLAFLSAGHVPGEGPYGETVEKGVRWVLNIENQNGLLATGGAHEMYHHGISTLMLAEVAGMTDAPLGKKVKARLEKAVAVILKAQRTAGAHRGGWRYGIVGLDADLSVTGWQLLALRAAKNLGCDVPGEPIDRAIEYVKRCRDSFAHGYGYMPGFHPSVACTGTGILCLEVCGKDTHRTPEALRAAAVVLREAPDLRQPHFCYTVYHCSQAMFQLGKNYWGHYRPLLHKVLLDNQQDNGSWAQGDGYGPSYATAMCVLALTVEYRFLPIYQRGEDAAEK